jgi:biopolymer transport protein ExbD
VISLRLPRRRALPGYEATIPLINVAFLLLAFFMLVGRTDATAPFEVTPPRSGAGAPLPQGGATVSVSASGGLALDGAELGAAEIVETLEAAAGAGGADLVRVNADAGARLGDLLPLVAALEASGVTRIVLVVTPPEPAGP